VDHGAAGLREAEQMKGSEVVMVTFVNNKKAFGQKKLFRKRKKKKQSIRRK
jgi:hypothetical protein